MKQLGVSVCDEKCLRRSRLKAFFVFKLRRNTYEDGKIKGSQ